MRFIKHVKKLKNNTQIKIQIIFKNKIEFKKN